MQMWIGRKYKRHVFIYVWHWRESVAYIASNGSMLLLSKLVESIFLRMKERLNYSVLVSCVVMGLELWI